MKKSIGVVALATAAALLITGCSPTAEDGGEQTLYVLTSDTAIELDPATNLGFPTTWLGLVARRLTTWSIDESGNVEVVPDLATDTGTPNEDGTEWTYTLKDGITFEDGTAITSADIKFGVERTFAPELAGGLTYHNGLLIGGDEYTGPYEDGTLDSIETPDDKTIVFKLNASFGDWPWLAAMNAFVPVPASAPADGSYTKKPVASGPYRVESNNDGTETVLIRNESWDAATDDVRTADPDRIVIKQSQNPSTIAQTLISDVGDAKSSFNAYALGAAELALVHSDPSAVERLVTSGGGPLTYLALNVDRPGLSDPNVRQAVQHAIDRNAIVLALGGDELVAPATSMIPQGIPGHNSDDPYPRDIDKARQLLSDAGYPDGITLELWVTNEDTAAAQALQQSLAEAGITVNITPLDAGVLYGDAMGGNPDYDMMISYWIGDYPSPASNISLLFDSAYIDGGFNLSRLNSPELDAAIHTATTETDGPKAVAQWSAIDKQILAAASVAPLYVTRNSFLHGSKIDSFEVPAFPGFQNYLTITMG